ncbi:MAG TPA: phosphoribosylpyrophosphate synthetase [Panacibacter sp.]|nr:phosphoribosylpyrophosphate synthetase [Panacibacter sp.]HNP45837.1 phosphoribosylpyrophosphate synthetase [Panacibacter sp.]
MIAYDTLSEALDGLKARGFAIDFNLAFDHLKCSATGLCLNPAQFEIVEHHRFEGMSDPDDASVLYAVESLDGTAKGVLVSAYGVYSESISEEMIRKLKIQHV